MDETSNQISLEQVTFELRDVMVKHGVGGVVLAISEDSAAWITVFPEWSALQLDDDHGMIFKVGRGEPGNHRKVQSTLHLIASVKDMCLDYANVFGQFFRQVKQQIEQQGGEVEHTPFAGGRRIDPLGGRRG